MNRRHKHFVISRTTRVLVGRRRNLLGYDREYQLCAVHARNRVDYFVMNASGVYLAVAKAHHK